MWGGAVSALSLSALQTWVHDFEDWSVIWVPLALVMALLMIPWILGVVLQFAGDVHSHITGGGVVVGDYFHRMSREEAESGLMASGAFRIGGPGLREQNQEWGYADESGKIVSNFNVTWWEQVQAKRRRK